MATTEQIKIIPIKARMTFTGKNEFASWTKMVGTQLHESIKADVSAIWMIPKMNAKQAKTIATSCLLQQWKDTLKSVPIFNLNILLSVLNISEC